MYIYLCSEGIWLVTFIIEKADWKPLKSPTIPAKTGNRRWYLILWKNADFSITLKDLSNKRIVLII
jgi:hypothetical protein